jgi:small conductance mechanosensitive channel
MTVPLDQLNLKLMPLTRADLAEEAASVRDLARSMLEDLAAAKIQLNQATGDRVAGAKERAEWLAHECRDVFQRLDTVLTAWGAKGGDPAAIAEYRQYMGAVMVEGVKSADASALVATVGKWLVSRDGGIALGIKMLVLVLAFVVLLFVAKFVSSLARRGVKRVPNLSTLLANFTVRASFLATLILGLMIVLAMMGADMGPVFAVVGGASFIAAFALQSTLSNFAAGLMIMVYRPFDVGNFVTLAGVSGTVKKVSLVSTTLTTPDNQIITIPNGNVWGSIITNVTANDTRRVDLVFGIAYGDDADKASRIMEDVVKAHPLVLADPAPVIRMNQLADSSVNFVCRPWARTGDYWAVYWDLTQQVKGRFDEEGISIPFPQRDVHVYNNA